MAGYRIPQPLCGTRGAGMDPGTSCLARTPLPGPMSVMPGQQPDAGSWIRDTEWHALSVPWGFYPSTMRLGPEGRALLKSVEALRLEPYDDQSGAATAAWVAGATVGYGHLIRESEWDTWKGGITEAQASDLFDDDLRAYEDAVRNAIGVGLQQHEFDALVVFAFNIGVAGFKKSTVVRLINAGPRSEADTMLLHAAWSAWNRSQGKVMRGLVNRRDCEWKIFTRAVYERW
ncbi:MAG: lysozyme [Burkholderiales bacterium]|nr:lysozyme [Burkholderiales bacterium]